MPFLSLPLPLSLSLSFTLLGLWHTLFHESTRRAYTRSYKDSEVRPGRVSELYTNVKGNHNVVIYCRARYCGRFSRGRCDGSGESQQEKTCPRIVRTRPDAAAMRFVSILLHNSLDTILFPLLVASSQPLLLFSLEKAV